MTDSALRKFNDYLPYRKDWDVLSESHGHNSLQCFPESADTNPSEETNSGLDSLPNPLHPDDNGEDLNEIDQIMRIDIDENIPRLEEWIQKFRKRNVPVDINRITHCAIFKGRDELVKHLVENEHAKLKQKDKLGRSAIFYAAGRNDPAMLEYIGSELGATTFKEELSRPDVDKRTPSYYAAKFLCVSNVIFCLAAGARPDDATVALASGPESEMAGRMKQIRLLFTLYNQLDTYLRFPVYTESSGYSGKEIDHSTFSISEMQTNRGPLTALGSAKGGLIWIHIPWTNGVMLFAAVKLIENRIQKRERYGESAYVEFFLHGFRGPPTVIGDPLLNYRVPIHESDRAERLDEAFLAAVVFPCLALQDMKSFTDSRKIHHDLRESMGWDFAESLIQVARTLDEAYYPSLDQKVLTTRNKDQVVSRECRKLLTGEDVSNDTRPILMVPQFWIWKFEGHILSAYSMPGKNPDTLLEHNFDGDLNFDYQRWKSKNIGISTSFADAGHPDLHIGFLLAERIDKFGKAQADMFQSPLDIFETGVIQVISRVETFMKQPTSVKSDDIKKERDFMHDISDIRSELAMIDEILRQQKDILETIIKNACVDVRDPTWRKVVDASQQLDTYRQRVNKIDRDAERIEKNIQDQLNLKRTYASIRDARTSVVLGTAVIGFTIVTVIFTPLAFMTSLFALPIDNIVKHQVKIGDTNAYGTGYIGKWFATAEISTLVFTGLAVCASLMLLNYFGGGVDDPGHARRESPRRSAEDDGKTTGLGSKVTDSRTLRSFWKRPKNSKQVSEA